MKRHAVLLLTSLWQLMLAPQPTPGRQPETEMPVIDIVGQPRTAPQLRPGLQRSAHPTLVRELPRREFRSQLLQSVAEL